MIGNGLLAFGVFVIVAIFFYLSFRYQQKAEHAISYAGKYTIEISNDFAGDSIAIYINDSLLLDRIMPDETLQLSVKRFAENSALLVVDNRTDGTTPFNLSDKGSRVKLTRKNGIIYLLETKK